MNLKKTVIKVLNEEHGAKVIQWFKDQGVSTNGYTGEMVGDYYGLSSTGTFINSSTVSSTYNVIELPSEHPKRGDIVLVWDDNEEDAEKATFLCFIKGASFPIITVACGFEDEFLCNEEFITDKWGNYKLITKEQPLVEPLVELTMDEALNELAKVKNVDVSRLRIKK